MKDITTRDYFAAKAMQGMFSNVPFMDSLRRTSEKHNMEVDAGMSKAAYEMADAMLKEKAKYKEITCEDYIG